MRKILPTLLLCFSPAASALDEWSATDKALGAAMAAAVIVDWGQTRHIAKNPHLFREKNPLMGSHPSVGRVNAHFVSVLVVTAAIANALPSKHRKAFLVGALAVEVAVIRKNKHIGVRVSF